MIKLIKLKKLIFIMLISAFVLVACGDSDPTESSSSSASSAPGTETSCGDPFLSPDSTHTVNVETTQGNFVIELDVANAPIGSAHFAALVKEGFYDGLIFHRVIPEFVIQGGDEAGTGSGPTDCQLETEAPPGPYQAGDVAWARLGTDPAGTAGTQFFVMDSANGLPTEYGYVGKVIEGIEVVNEIARVERDPRDKPVVEVVMTKLTLNS